MTQRTKVAVAAIAVAVVMVALFLWATTPRSYGGTQDRKGPGGDVTQWHGGVEVTPVGAVRLLSAKARCDRHCRRAGRVKKYRVRIRRGSKFVASRQLGPTIDPGEIEQVLTDVTQGSGSGCFKFTVYLSGGNAIDHSVIRAQLGMRACRPHRRWKHVQVTSTHTEADDYWFWTADKGVHDWVRHGCTSGGSCRRWYRRATFHFHRGFQGFSQNEYPFIAQGGRRDGTWGWDRTGHD